MSVRVLPQILRRVAPGARPETLRALADQVERRAVRVVERRKPTLRSSRTRPSAVAEPQAAVSE